jgi:lysine 2,3-aminomutase
MSDKQTEFPHRQFRDDSFWKQIPGWKNVSKKQFADYLWQSKNSITKVSHIKEVLRDRINQQLLTDIEDGIRKITMNVRITPYIFSLFNWDDPRNDGLRKQFLPLASELLPDHPYHLEDSLYEDVDSPVPLLTHRYPDKVLFLPLSFCPVYCSYCTRSRMIGGSTHSLEKESLGIKPQLWDPVFEYLRERVEIEDVVISGGDVFNLKPDYIRLIGRTLLEIPNIRRIRFATKGLAVIPMKILSHDEWVKALIEVERYARSLGKQVMVHTHFSCPGEITIWSKMAMERLFAEGIIVRNQAVLQEGVNNTPEDMVLMTRKLGYINIQPYYVYIHDMVPGCERFRTTLREAMQLEKSLRGATAGFNTPRFVCDVPRGGGKRQISSYEYYNEETGVSVWVAPGVKPEDFFIYLDPIHKLSEETQKRWQSHEERGKMIKEALAGATPAILDTLTARFRGSVLK